MPSGDTPRASIHDVARRAGVSAATVSKVLRGVETVKPANVARVKAAVEALDYRLDPLASGLRKATRDIVGLIVPDLENEFFGRLASRIELLAEEAGFSLSIASSHESEARESILVERMMDWRVAGTILAPVRSERGPGAGILAAQGMRAVLIDRVVAHGTLDTVAVDNSGASARVARELAALGHRHVLVLGPNEVSKNIRIRAQGFRDEAARAFPDMRVDVLLTDGQLDGLRSALAAYLDRTRPTAVFSLYQKGTLAVLSEFRRRRIRCPDEISLVGFDDADWMQTTYPAVAAVIQPIDRIADSAFRRLQARIAAGAGAPVRHLELCNFDPRDSLAPPGDAAGPARAISAQ